MVRCGSRGFVAMVVLVQVFCACSLEQKSILDVEQEHNLQQQQHSPLDYLRNLRYGYHKRMKKDSKHSESKKHEKMKKSNKHHGYGYDDYYYKYQESSECCHASWIGKDGLFHSMQPFDETSSDILSTPHD